MNIPYAALAVLFFSMVSFISEGNVFLAPVSYTAKKQVKKNKRHSQDYFASASGVFSPVKKLESADFDLNESGMNIYTGAGTVVYAAEGGIIIGINKITGRKPENGSHILYLFAPQTNRLYVYKNLSLVSISEFLFSLSPEFRQYITDDERNSSAALMIDYSMHEQKPTGHEITGGTAIGRVGRYPGRKSRLNFSVYQLRGRTIVRNPFFLNKDMMLPDPVKALRNTPARENKPVSGIQTMRKARKKINSKA